MLILAKDTLYLLLVETAQNETKGNNKGGMKTSAGYWIFILHNIQSRNWTVFCKYCRCAFVLCDDESKSAITVCANNTTVYRAGI